MSKCQTVKMKTVKENNEFDGAYKAYQLAKTTHAIK